MFEEGVRLKRERRSPAANLRFLARQSRCRAAALGRGCIAANCGRQSSPGSHGYMPNPGYPEVREVVARKLRRETGLDFYGRGRLYDDRLGRRLQRDP